jgi:5-methylcytosine-specific restriction endonuclease McrA
MTLDHLISKKDGGGEGENLVPVCRLCNSLKGRRSFSSIEDARSRMPELREKYLTRWEYYELKKKYRST